MNLISRTITGTMMVVGGLFLIILSFFITAQALWVTLIYGIPLFILGLFILFNKKEDEIEQIKGRKKK